MPLFTAPTNAAADLEPPDTTIYSGPEEGSTIHDPTPTFGFFSSEFPEFFECRVDGEEFASCESPYTSVPLAEGLHTFEVQAKDESGNTDPTPASRTFTFEPDLEPPETTIYSGPEEGSTTHDPTPTFYFESSEFPSSFECRIDSEEFAPCSFGFTTNPLVEGEHTFEVRAIDESNNVDPTPASRTFTFEPDLEPPETTINAGPENGSTTSDPTPQFEFSSSEFPSTASNAGSTLANSRRALHPT